MSFSHAARVVVASMAAVVWLGGCAHSPKSSDSLKLEVQMAQKQYRPGEAVVASVKLSNLGDGKIDVPALNFNSLKFYMHPTKEPNLSLQRYPVYSAREAQPVQYMVDQTVEEKGSVSRDFLFTQLTEDPASYTFTAAYDPNPPKAPMGTGKKLKAEKPSLPLVWANAQAYSVQGPPAYKRDSKGILLKEDAVRVASASFGAAPQSSRAQLVWNDNGFLVWWVRLEPAQSGVPKAYFVQPYTARIISDAPLEAPATQPSEETRVKRRMPSGTVEP